MSNFFSTRATKGLLAVGEIYCPKNGEFPSFKEVAGTAYLNNLVRNVPEDDFSSLSLVMAFYHGLSIFVEMLNTILVMAFYLPTYDN